MISVLNRKEEQNGLQILDPLTRGASDQQQTRKGHLYLKARIFSVAATLVLLGITVAALEVYPEGAEGLVLVILLLLGHIMIVVNEIFKEETLKDSSILLWISRISPFVFITLSLAGYWAIHEAWFSHAVSVLIDFVAFWAGIVSAWAIAKRSWKQLQAIGSNN